MVHLIALGLALASSLACGPTAHVMRHGGARAARAEGCKMRFADDVDPQTVTLRYQLVGHVVVTGGSPSSARELVRRRACALGGRFVVPGAALGAPGSETATYLVLGEPRDQPLTIGQAMKAGAAAQLALGKRSQERVVVAVFDIQDTTRSLGPTQRDQLSAYLATRLAGKPGYGVTPRGALRQRLVAQRKQSHRACYDARCQIEIGKALAAQKSLSTRLLRVGDSCAFAANLYDLRSETSERAATVHCVCEGSGLLGAVDRLVDELIK